MFFNFGYTIERYYNAGEKPVTEILNPHPELIHRVEGRFNCDVTTAGKIYHQMNYNWRRLDATHLLMRWREAGRNIIKIPLIHLFNRYK